MSAQDKASIADKINQWTKAVSAKDAAKVATFFTSDVVQYDIAPPLKNVGFDVSALEKWFKTWDGPIDYEATEQEITVSDTLAVARSLDHMTGKKVDGEKVDLWTRSTVCFRQEGGQWKVFHVHSSVPMLMDGSGKAATDLKP